MRSRSNGSSLPLASEHLQRLQQNDPLLLLELGAVYGPSSELLRDRCRAMSQALERFVEAFGDLPCAVYRAPARISLNPHCDHQGAWVPYGLHSRELIAVMAPADERVEIVNVDPAFAPLLSFCPEEEIRRGHWPGRWLEYIESRDVVAEVSRNLDAKSQTQDRHATTNYVRGAAMRVRHQFPDRSMPGLRIALHGNIPQGGGLSSSSALVVLTSLATLEFAGRPMPREHLAELCGEAEWYVGTRGGSGDHAAMLLGTRAGLAHLCFQAPVGVRGVRHSPFPTEYQLVLANSQTRSEKSSEERLLFNRGIFAYRFAFLALKAAMREIGLPEAVVAETQCLGDLHRERVSPADLYRMLLQLPESISARTLATQFPGAFGPAARGCFGTDDPERLPAEIPLRGAAVYGLGRVDRGLAMPGLLEQGDDLAMAEFGSLMTVTHDGDRLFLHGEPYSGGRERLADGRLQDLLRRTEEGDEQPLRNEPGFYGASIAELDRMVDCALQTEGVLGAGLMGAGGGGYVLILARRGAFEGVRDALIREYYAPLGKDPDVEPWQPTGPAGRVL